MSRFIIAACMAATCLDAVVEAAFTGLAPVAEGLGEPIYVTHAPGDRQRAFIVERHGRISVLNLETDTVEATPFLTIPETDAEGEGGLLSMAFHPDYATNGKFYVYVTVDNGGMLIDGTPSRMTAQIREYTVSSDPNVAQFGYRPILDSVRPDAGHLGGWIGFSPIDNYLYIMSGDGGHSLDSGPGHTLETGNAQDLTDNLFGKVLRIDVNGDDFSDNYRNYAIPPTNPFVDAEGDDEIWAYGLRNPYRASFDRATGDLWIGDVGQNQREEINYQHAASEGGENYGWRLREGSLPTQLVGGDAPPGAVEPIYDYGRTGDYAGRVVIGGFVYRGPDPELQGQYIFGDGGAYSEPSHQMWSLNAAAIIGGAEPLDSIANLTALLSPDEGEPFYPISFGEDAVGNLYVTYRSGEVYRLRTDAVMPGDFEIDADVDEHDLAVWRDEFGFEESDATSDANGDGRVDGADFLLWQREVGYSAMNALSAGVSSPLPEPGAATMGLTAVAATLAARDLLVRRRRRATS